jgi:hypothetical protein
MEKYEHFLECMYSPIQERTQVRHQFIVKLRHTVNRLCLKDL